MCLVKICFVICFLFISSLTVEVKGQGFFDFALDQHAMSNSESDSLNGKVVFIIRLPLQEDSVFAVLMEASSIALSNGLRLLALPDVACVPDRLERMISELQKLRSNIAIATPVNFSDRTSYPPFMEWLIRKDLNQHFELKSVGAGTTFIVNSKGELVSVLPQRALKRLDLLKKIIQNQIH